MEVNRALGVTLDGERAFEPFTFAALAALAEEMSEDEAARLLARLEG